MRNWRALAWALGVIAFVSAMATTRHHFEMIDHSAGGAYLTWGHAFEQEGAHWLFWAVAIPVVYLFVKWLVQRHWRWGWAVLAHLAFAIVTLALAAVFHALWYSKGIGDALTFWGASSVFTYGAILGGVLAYYYSQRYVEREVEIAGARLGALRAQLQPHFMFNALNSVAMLVRGGRGPEAVEMIARVSSVLRDSLDEDDRAEVPLEEEVASARRYLAIEEVRFADRLQVREDIAEHAKHVRVPRLILQPIVENAVRHGIGKRAGAGRIEIAARTTDRELILVVSDDGPGPNGVPQAVGVGLKNTRERLAAAYGAAARFTLEHGPHGGAVATLVVPLR
ncbi:MAG TPA: histidine kinase [Gemmatimonadales bacterium]|nr:histidine kinase [Gemmatimonadales bacterium]